MNKAKMCLIFYIKISFILIKLILLLINSLSNLVFDF